MTSSRSCCQQRVTSSAGTTLSIRPACPRAHTPIDSRRSPQIDQSDARSRLLPWRHLLRGGGRILHDWVVSLHRVKHLMRHHDLVALAIFRRCAGGCARGHWLSQQERRGGDRERRTNEDESPRHRPPPSEARQLQPTRFGHFDDSLRRRVVPRVRMLIPIFRIRKNN